MDALFTVSYTQVGLFYFIQHHLKYSSFGGPRLTPMCSCFHWPFVMVSLILFNWLSFWRARSTLLTCMGNEHCQLHITWLLQPITVQPRPQLWWQLLIFSFQIHLSRKLSPLGILGWKSSHLCLAFVSHSSLTHPVVIYS